MSALRRARGGGARRRSREKFRGRCCCFGGRAGWKPATSARLPNSWCEIRIGPKKANRSRRTRRNWRRRRPSRPCVAFAQGRRRQLTLVRRHDPRVRPAVGVCGRPGASTARGAARVGGEGRSARGLALSVPRFDRACPHGDRAGSTRRARKGVARQLVVITDHPERASCVCTAPGSRPTPATTSSRLAARRTRWERRRAAGLQGSAARNLGGVLGVAARRRRGTRRSTACRSSSRAPPARGAEHRPHGADAGRRAGDARAAGTPTRAGAGSGEPRGRRRPRLLASAPAAAAYAPPDDADRRGRQVGVRLQRPRAPEPFALCDEGACSPP